MKHEPTVDKEALRAALREQYGVDAARLSFLPAGQNSLAYVAQAGDRRYVLKVLGPHPLGWTEPVHLDYYLSLTVVLAGRGYAARVVPPVPAFDGALWTWWDGAPGRPRLVLYPYLEGRLAGGDWREHAGTLRAVAETLGRLHADTGLVRGRVPALAGHAETFDVSFGRDLPALVEALERSTDLGLAAGELRRVLLARREQIAAHVERLGEFSRAARAAYPDTARMVLCHTDVNLFNLLVDAEGAVSLLDWESAGLAPMERDLLCLLGGADARTDLALGWYEAAGGSRAPSADVLSFYKYRRPLFELAYFARRILSPGTPEEQRRCDLEEIQHDILDWWDELPAQAAALAALANRRRRFPTTGNVE